MIFVERQTEPTAEQRETDKKIRAQVYRAPPENAVVLEIDSWRTVYPKPLIDISTRLFVEQESFVVQSSAIQFLPLQRDEGIRSRFEVSRVRGICPAEIYRDFWMSAVPGIYVGLDLEKSEGWLFDPLSTDEGRKIYEKWVAAMQNSGRFAGHPGDPWPSEVIQLDEEGRLTWELYLSELVERTPIGGDRGECRVIRNSHKLRPTKLLKELGKVPILSMHPAGSLISGNPVWTAENMPDRPLSEKTAAIVRELLTELRR